MSNQEERPPININGALHKIGLHGLVYWKSSGDWVRSTKTVEELERAYEVEADRKAKAG